MSTFFSYNQIINKNIKPINENIKQELHNKEFFKQSKYLDESIIINPCRSLWAIYKLMNNMSDEQFSKKLLQDIGAKEDHFINYAENLNKRIDYYLLKTNPKLNQIDREKAKKKLLINLFNNLSDKCTIDRLSSKSNPLANAILSQMLNIPTSKDNNDDNIYTTILNYSNMGYKHINAALRGEQTNPLDKTINDIVNLDLVFDFYGVASVGNPRGLRLFRGSQDVGFFRNGNGKFRYSANVNELQVGDVIFESAYMSTSMDINSSLNPEFFKFDVKNKISPCCCILTFIYPPHMPFLPMADFNIENIVSKEEIVNKQTLFGFTETEILLPRYLSLRVVDKIKLNQYLYADSGNHPDEEINGEVEFNKLTLIVCEVVFNLDKNLLNNIKNIKNPVNVSAMLYKNTIIQRNSNLSQNVIKKYNTDYERKIDKFKIKKAWFNNPTKPDETIKFVLNPNLQMGGEYYDKYVKYKSKYLELKNILEGGQVSNNILTLLKAMLKLFLVTILEQNCCSNLLGNYKFNVNGKEAAIGKDFTKLFNDNQKLWKNSVGGLSFLTSSNYDIYNTWIKNIYSKNFNLEKNIITILNMYIKFLNNYNNFLKVNSNNPISSTIINNTIKENICVACEQENKVCKKVLYFDLPITNKVYEQCSVGTNETLTHCCDPNTKTVNCIIEHGEYLGKIFLEFEKLQSIVDNNIQNKIAPLINQSKTILNNINSNMANIKFNKF